MDENDLRNNIDDENIHQQEMKNEKTESDKTKEFYKICKDFIVDILTTFPEFKNELDEGFISILEEDYDKENVYVIYTHCKEIFPKHFFDILYQNEEVFINNETLFLLPNIDFVYIWKQNISEHTKGVIWKYLQLILFTLISDVKDGSAFGDTAKLFEAINEDEFKNKLEETLESMSSFFDENMNTTVPENNDGSTDEKSFPRPQFTMDGSSINLDSLPNPEDIHSHINGMLDGKLGNLAREIAEETAQELNIDMEGASSVQDVFKQLFKNPGKLMSIVKNVGNKLETKLKSGELNESDLIKETTDMMSRMKDMPGMGNIHKMMREMGVNMPIPGGGKNGKVNMGAFQSHMNTNLKNAKMKERMREKLEQRQMMQKQQETHNNSNINNSNNTTNDCFSPENQQRNTTTVGDGFLQNIKYTKGETAQKSRRIKQNQQTNNGNEPTNNNEKSVNVKNVNDKKKKKRKNKK